MPPHYDPATFKSFADWCHHRDSLPPNTQHTVDLLWQEAGHFDDDCNKASERLSSRTSLGFSHKKLNDLRPFQCLTNLKSLNLSSNRIKDLSPLRSLTHLECLSLSGNQITDLNPLKALTNLCELNLSGNRIQDLSPLSSLTRLESLSIVNNPTSDLSPLQSLTNLKTLRLNPLSPTFLQPFQERCQQAVCSTQPINPQNAIQAVQAAYRAIGKGIPEILICRSPGEVETRLQELLNVEDTWETWLQQQESADGQLCEVLKDEIRFFSSDEFYLLSDSITDINPLVEMTTWEKYLWLRAYQQIGKPLQSQLCFWSTDALSLCNPMSQGWQKGLRNARLCWLRPAWNIEQRMVREISEAWSRDCPGLKSWFLKNTIVSTDLLDVIHLIDFHCLMLDGTLNSHQQHAYRCLTQLVKHCGWIIPFEKVCLVYDRPTKILLDSDGRLQVGEEPAIQFADGWSVKGAMDFRHGTTRNAE